MKEEIDPKTREFWEKKLAESGLPTGDLDKNIQERVPMEALSAGKSSNELFNKLDEAQKITLEKYEALPKKIQKDIYEDIVKQKQAGEDFEAITARLDELVKQGHNLVELSAEDSDTKHKPKPGPEESKLEKEKGEISKKIEGLLEKLREIIHRDKEKPSKKDYIN